MTTSQSPSHLFVSDCPCHRSLILLRLRKSLERNARFHIVLEFRSTGASGNDGSDVRLQLLREGDVITANHDPMFLFLNSLPLLVNAAPLFFCAHTLMLSPEHRVSLPAHADTFISVSTVCACSHITGESGTDAGSGYLCW